MHCTIQLNPLNLKPPVFRSWIFGQILWLTLLFAPVVQGQNVIWVIMDGVRRQEVFSGAADALMNKASGGVENADALRKEFWRETPESRREALMPFLWGTAARKGQLFGNIQKKCAVRIVNGFNFSYPCYNEILTGLADPRIDSNDKKPNPNITVLEWLDRRHSFEGRTAFFGAWDVFPSILNRERAKILVNAGEPLPGGGPRQEFINEIKTDLGDALLDECGVYDAVIHHSAIEYLKEKKPRVLCVVYGATDTLGHQRRYDRYLQAIRRCDNWLQRLWETSQTMSNYRGKTSLVVLTDHGRGDAPADWPSHGKVAGAEYIWIGVMGPKTAAKGEREEVEVTETQVAATVAALAGEDYAAAEARAGKPLPVLPETE